MSWVGFSLVILIKMIKFACEKSKIFRDLCVSLCHFSIMKLVVGYAYLCMREGLEVVGMIRGHSCFYHNINNLTSVREHFKK